MQKYSMDMEILRGLRLMTKIVSSPVVQKRRSKQSEGDKSLSLNKSQELAEKAIVGFLMNPNEKYLILEAPSGYGKTYLMNHINMNMGKYAKRAKVLNSSLPSRLEYAAPTNKAASLGFKGTTIHKLLKLMPQRDYTTGTHSLMQRQPTMVEAVVIDEWTMVSTDLLKYIDVSTRKVIFVGDSYQLPPVGESVSPVALLNAKRVSLTTPQRQSEESGLFKMCQHLRTMVEQKKVIPTSLNEDCIFLTGSEMEAMLDSHFGKGGNNRIITFTNKKAIRINNSIRKKHGYSDYWSEGESVITKSFTNSVCGTSYLPAEADCIVEQVDEDQEHVLINGCWYQAAKDHGEVTRAITALKKKQAYADAFNLQESWLDIRAGYAGTCHSMQGSTYDNVFIDLSDFNECFDRGMLTRLLYVAVSRARHKVYFYGKSRFQLF